MIERSIAEKVLCTYLRLATRIAKRITGEWANRASPCLIPRKTSAMIWGPVPTRLSARPMTKSVFATQVLSVAVLCAALVGCSSTPEYATALTNQAAWTGTPGGAALSGPNQFDALLSLAGKGFVGSDSRLDLLSEDGGNTLVLIHSRADLPRGGIPWKVRKGAANGHLVLLAHGQQWAASYYHARILPSGDLLLGWVTEDGEARGFTYRVPPDGSVYQRSVGNIQLDGSFSDSAAYASHYRPERAGMAVQAAANMRAKEGAEVQRKREEQAESDASSAATYRALQGKLADAQAREAASRASTAAATHRLQQPASTPVARSNGMPPTVQHQAAAPLAANAPAPQITAAAARVVASATNASPQKPSPSAAASTLEDPSGCVSDPEPMKHPNCKDGTAFGVRNSCTQAVDVRMCIKTTAGRWDCGVSPTVNPGGRWSYPSCTGTSTVWTDARSAGPRARRFNDPP